MLPVRISGPLLSKAMATGLPGYTKLGTLESFYFKHWISLTFSTLAGVIDDWLMILHVKCLSKSQNSSQSTIGRYTTIISAASTPKIPVDYRDYQNDTVLPRMSRARSSYAQRLNQHYAVEWSSRRCWSWDLVNETSNELYVNAKKKDKRQNKTRQPLVVLIVLPLSFFMKWMICLTDSADNGWLASDGRFNVNIHLGKPVHTGSDLRSDRWHDCGYVQ